MEWIHWQGEVEMEMEYERILPTRQGERRKEAVAP